MTAPLGVSGASDAELVGRVLQADREAFAAVYDRYGARLYDFAHSMLRQREDAADAVADSFLSSAEKIAQLRHPDRLRPWLYGIVRSECLRRLKSGKRFAHGDEQQLDLGELQQLVWEAVGGLADRDRALLDLNLRQGLEGADLGEAVGANAANADAVLNRLRSQLERPLGAHVVASLGREDCTELDRLLTGWDGSFSPLIRKRVARHVDKCDVCGERRSVVGNPLALLASVPIVALPVVLRDRVLDGTTLVARTGVDAGIDIFGERANAEDEEAGDVDIEDDVPEEPVVAEEEAVVEEIPTEEVPEEPVAEQPGTEEPDDVSGAVVAGQVVASQDTPIRRRRTGRVAAALLAAAALIAGAIAFWPGDGAVEDVPRAVGDSPSATPTPTPSASVAGPVKTPSPTPSATPTRTASASPRPTPSAARTPGRLVLSVKAIDLGATGTRQTFRMTNVGDEPIDVSTASITSWLAASRLRGSLRAGGSVDVRVEVHRSLLPQGASSGRVQVTWSGRTEYVVVTARH